MNGLQVKKFTMLQDQEIDNLVGRKFSLKKYLKNIGREYDNDGNYTWNFSKGLGYYEVYKPIQLSEGQVFYALELAVTTMTRFMVVSTKPDFKTGRKFRLPLTYILKARAETFRLGGQSEQSKDDQHKA